MYIILNAYNKEKTMEDIKELFKELAEELERIAAAGTLLQRPKQTKPLKKK